MSKMRLYDEELRFLVTEVIKVLCRKRMQFETKLCVEGLVGVTIDEQNVFWVKIDESCNKDSFVDKFPSHCRTLLLALEKALEICDNSKGSNGNNKSALLTNAKRMDIGEKTSVMSEATQNLSAAPQIFTNGEDNADNESKTKDLNKCQTNVNNSAKLSSSISHFSGKSNSNQSDSDVGSPVNLGTDVVITENRSEEYSVDDLNMCEGNETPDTGTTTPVDLRCISAEPEGLDAQETEYMSDEDTEDDDDDENGIVEAEDLSLPKHRKEQNKNEQIMQDDCNESFGISELPESPGCETSTTFTSQGNSYESAGMSMTNPLFRYSVPPHFGLGPMALAAANPFASAVNAAMGVGIPLQVPSIMHRMAQSKTSTNRSSFASNLYSPQSGSEKQENKNWQTKFETSSSDLTSATPSINKQKTESARAKIAASLTESMSGTESHKCANCGTTKTTVWRRDDAFRIVCNACGLYFRLHKRNRPVHWAGKDIATRRRKKNSPFPSSPVLSSPRQQSTTTPLKGSSLNPMATLQQMLSSSSVTTPNYYSARNLVNSDPATSQSAEKQVKSETPGDISSPPVPIETNDAVPMSEEADVCKSQAEAEPDDATAEQDPDLSVKRESEEQQA